MFSVKFVTSSLRGVTAMASNQVGATYGGNKTNLSPRPQISTHYSNSSIHSRHVTTSSTSYLATKRVPKVNKVDIATLEANLNLPPKPKKPVTPWIMFVRERKDDILNEHMSAAKMSVILAQEWKQLDKTRYEEQYDRMHNDYKRQMDEYKKSLTDEHKVYLQQKNLEKRNKRALKQLKKTDIPVLPRNAANFFCQERCKESDIKEQLKHRKSQDVFRDLFEEYRNLSELEMQKYLKMQEEDKSRFQHEFLTWYESVQSNDELSRAALDLAESIRDKYKAII